MPTVFKDFDVTGFWSDDEYSKEEYVEKPLTARSIALVEKKLGYKLPKSYIELLHIQNGGLVNKTCFPTNTPTSWAEDHVAIEGIAGIGHSKEHSLCGSLGSKFMIEEWGYPDIGVCVCDCPSAGHDVVMLDYSECGTQGEPRVVHVDQEMDYTITVLAPSFESFIRGLVSPDVYVTSAADLEDALTRIRSGSFSSVLTHLLASKAGHGLETHVRALLASVTQAKGGFALHQDEESLLVYDLQFYLCQKNQETVTREEYMKHYPSMIAFSDGSISTKGYSPSFIEDWLALRIANGQITQNGAGRLCCSSSFEDETLTKLRAYN